MARGIRYFIRVISSNVLSLFGATLVSISAGFILLFILLTSLGRINSPYLGILTFLVLPSFFFLGLLLIPLGALWQRRQQRLHGDGTAEGDSGLFPVIDLNAKKTRQMFLVVAVLSMVNLFTVSLVSYQGVIYTESNTFCGQVCHEVMEPEFTAYQHSPHAQVHCVECHIGPGATSFVQAKLSGVRQVLGVITQTYSRPIETPVHNLRPAEQICGECHWQELFTGDQLVVDKYYLDDEANTPMYNVLMMHLGGGQDSGSGIHSWHANDNKVTTFLASDEKRQKIDVVRVTEQDGTVTEYRTSDTELTDADIAAGTFRTMDCTDCHNRPAHVYKSPATLVDNALTRGHISAEIPYIRMKAIEAFTEAGNAFAPWDGAKEQLAAYYAENHPEVVSDKKAELDAAMTELESLYTKNVFPKMNVKWDTYPNNIGHTESVGCFRCHDDSHTSPDGRVISQDCSVCHTVIAWEEESPEILSQLGMP